AKIPDLTLGESEDSERRYVTLTRSNDRQFPSFAGDRKEAG
ncbi:MAG: hypothetical protein ACJAXT_001689, partial [Paracoccaceae bacterium]